MYSSRVTAAILSTRSTSPLRLPQWRAVDDHGVTVVAQPAKQGLHHGPVAQKIGPLVIDEIGGNDGGMPAVAFFHQLEENVRLLRSQIQISEFVDQEDVQPHQTIQQLPSRTIRQ